MRDEGQFHKLLQEEHDSCGIICLIEKDGHPTHSNIQQTIDALIKMEHRSGFINGEGDGCGLLTDLPRRLWEARLTDAGHTGDIAYNENFAVAHIFLPRQAAQSVEVMQAGIRAYLKEQSFEILLEQQDRVDSQVLGPNGRNDEPSFWQVAGLYRGESAVSPALFAQHVQIEKQWPVHVASFSQYTAAYKVMGSASILPNYYADTRNPLFASQVTIGHNRYSTNTLSSFFRVQPFSLLGHNGEINTVKKLRSEAEMIGVPLVDGGSDSQDLNRTVETLIHQRGFSLFEAMELVFPPILNEMKHYGDELQDLYVYYRQIWGHFAQGPAGIVSRYGNECVFSVDALGLRPVWMVETASTLFFSSEQGIVSVNEMVAEPKPLAPGEKIGVELSRGEAVRVICHQELQHKVLDRARTRAAFDGGRQHLLGVGEPPADVDVLPAVAPTNGAYSAFGWEREQVQMIDQMANTGAEPIRSLGHDGPLACINPERQNIADYIKESVAVVTNPAIDRDRETEHFSTRVVVGPRPDVYGAERDQRLRVELPAPLLLEGSFGEGAYAALKTWSYEQLLAAFKQSGNRGDEQRDEKFNAQVGEQRGEQTGEQADHTTVATFSLSFAKGEKIADALKRLGEEACAAVKAGTFLIVLDDHDVHLHDRLWLDPHLAVSCVDLALRAEQTEDGNLLRRQASIVLRSGSIRSLHDIAVTCGLGADLISPYLLFATAAEKADNEVVYKVFTALQKGLEKVISTIGTHELRGYTRFFSSIGLKPEVAEVLDIVNYLGSETAGTGFAQMESDALERAAAFVDDKAKPARNHHIFTRIWKSLGDAASGKAPYSDYAEKLQEEELNTPVSIRHVTDFDPEKALQGRKPLQANDVDISVGHHSLPMLISSMSFGSQNEIAFRAYAEAGERLNMATMNGEGGEIKDMLGRYKRTRGAQIASGRFGVNVELANAVAFLEIKIGQGAKPGEGGHLPGSKVTEKIAEARNATIGSDLISPSNNHDIYSIEDLAQIISELKEASNHEAKIIVKVPVVPNIGTIAVGIAKAGADVITLSGFDGGTGAARMHALQHVGLPTEIGTKLAHVALIEAGLRHQVELWSDGGMKSGIDVAKMMMLGANRCGFGTLSMQAIGCTACRGCHLDTCHVGIATQIDSMDEAEEKGLRRFVPREHTSAIDNLVCMFTGMGDELRDVCAKLGVARAQDLVGRCDLLKQVACFEQIDLEALLRPAPVQFVNAAQEAARAEVTTNVLVAAAGAEAQRFSTADLSFDSTIEKSWSDVYADSRILGSRFASLRVKGRLDGSYDELPPISLAFTNGSVPGNGLAAFNARGLNITVHGGAEDGVGKMAFGGKVAILKSRSQNGRWLNGSVGKSFAYGAQSGLFLIQGNADSRACIRMSGADVVFGGLPEGPLDDSHGGLADRANLKGFAFEYMTNGRAVVLGDPGPWICAGMTGGVIYQRLAPELGLDEHAIRRRVAIGGKVNLEPLNDKGVADLQELLGAYHDELEKAEQAEAAAFVRELLEDLQGRFIQIVPNTQQADQSVATE